ncbi:MAG: aldehyde dehydrogenase family protein, partial [Candidatus Thiodiazotropha sp.]
MTLNDASLLKSLCYIDGQWVGADSGETMLVTNPATGEEIVSVPVCGGAETEKAIVAAQVAQKQWAAKT